jgi:hypothetical protein
MCRHWHSEVRSVIGYAVQESLRFLQVGPPQGHLADSPALERVSSCSSMRIRSRLLAETPPQMPSVSFCSTAHVRQSRRTGHSQQIATASAPAERSGYQSPGSRPRHSANRLHPCDLPTTPPVVAAVAGNDTLIDTSIPRWRRGLGRRVIVVPPSETILHEKCTRRRNFRPHFEARTITTCSGRRDISSESKVMFEQQDYLDYRWMVTGRCDLANSCYDGNESWFSLRDFGLCLGPRQVPPASPLDPGRAKCAAKRGSLEWSP